MVTIFVNWLTIKNAILKLSKHKKRKKYIQTKFVIMSLLSVSKRYFDSYEI